MSVKAKKVVKKQSSSNGGTTNLKESVGNYEKHPFFIKKANAAKALLEKVGLPKQLTSKA